MADFSVPSYADLINNGNDKIAAGPPKVDFSAIGNLPNNYWEGVAEKSKRDVREAFKDGVPTTADGSPDYSAMSKKLYQLGGLEQGDKFANTDIARQQLKLGQDVSDKMGALDNNGQPALPVPRVAPGQPQPSPQPAPQPRPPTGKAANAPTSLVSVISANGIPDEKAGGVITSLSRQLGVDPNAPLDMNDPRVRNVLVPGLQMAKRQLGIPDQPGQQPQMAQAPQQQPALQPQATPQPQAIAPQAAQAQAQAPAPQTFDSRYGVPPATDTRGGPPTGADPEVQKRIAIFTQIASNPALPESVRKAAQSRLDALQKQADPTGTMKEYDLARRQGYGGSLQEFEAAREADKTYASKSVETNVKKYEGIQELGTKAIQELPQLQLVKNQMDDPAAGFYSGVGEKYNLAIKRALTAVGGDPNAALPQEAFRKVVSGNILNSLGQLKGLGQIRVAEINLAKEASASADNTPAGNRLLVNVSMRMHQRASEIADMAQGYNGGRLDAGFDKLVTEYNKANPIFTDAEIKNPKLLSLPTFSSPEMAMKAPRGTEFIASDGKIRRVP